MQKIHQLQLKKAKNIKSFKERKPIKLKTKSKKKRFRNEKEIQRILGLVKNMYSKKQKADLKKSKKEKIQQTKTSDLTRILINYKSKLAKKKK